MYKLATFEPFFGMYLRTPAKRPASRGSFLSSRFASFTERERRYLSPKKLLPFALGAHAPVQAHA